MNGDNLWKDGIMPKVSIQDGSIVLNRHDEFEEALIELVEMHRVKVQVYGPAGQKGSSFQSIGRMENVDPLKVMEILAAKHKYVINKFIDEGCTNFSDSTDDAFTDRAVYAVLAKAYYERMKRVSYLDAES